MAPFPKLPLDDKHEGKGDGAQIGSQDQSEAKPLNQDNQGQPQQQPLSEEQIQACLRRANQVYLDPRTNTTRRNTNVPAGRNRNRSRAISYSTPPLPNLPQSTPSQAPNPTQLGTSVPRIVLTDTDALFGTTADRDLLLTGSRAPGLASGSGRGRGHSSAYEPARSLLPSLPHYSDRRAAPGRGRGRPITVGAYDNPVDESEHRRADREARISAINQQREVLRTQRLQDREAEEYYSQQQRQQAQGQPLPPSHSRPLPSAPSGTYPVGTPIHLRRPELLAGQQHTQPPKSPPDQGQQRSPTGDSEASDESEFHIGTARIGYKVVARTPRSLPSASTDRPALTRSFPAQSLLLPPLSSSVHRQHASSQVSSSKGSSNKDAPSKNRNKGRTTSAAALGPTGLPSVSEEGSDEEVASVDEDEDEEEEPIGLFKSQRPRDWERRDDQGPPPAGGARGTAGTGKFGSQSTDRGSSNEKRSSSGGIKHSRSFFGLKKKSEKSKTATVLH
ncbi:hypothetical protein HYQ44_016225 [Verticillium longisporum]|nr:hypothetical protein HYQ44_016225 [Verticillium longisporum]